MLELSQSNRKLPLCERRQPVRHLPAGHHARCPGHVELLLVQRTQQLPVR